MKKEEIAILAQILSAMRDGAEKLDNAERQKDLEKIKNIKHELMQLYQKMNDILKNDKRA